PVRGRDLHRRARVDPERGRGRREDRRGDRDQDALVRHAAAPAADRARRPPLRDRLHGRRLRRRADPDRRRAVQQHAGADDLVVRHGDQQRRARRRRRDLPLPVPAARSRDGRDALLRAPSSGRLMRKLPTYLVVTPFAIVLAFPFYWMLVTMFKEDSDLYSGPISNQHRIPYVYNPVRWEFWHSATTKHVAFIFEHTNYPTWIGNTLIVGAAVVGITLLFALPAGYSLARLAGRWGQSAGVGIFLVYLVPPTLLFLPLSRLITQLGLKDTLWALILVYPSFTIPFATWLLMGFFKTIPQELEDAALVDGCSRLKALWRIVFPISLPGILTVVIFSFSLCVN